MQNAIRKKSSPWPPNLDKESKLLLDVEGQTELENNFLATDSSVGKETIFPALRKTAMSNTGTWDVLSPSAGAMSLLDVQYVEATEREKLNLDGKESKKIFVPPSALLAAVTRKGNEIKNLLEAGVEERELLINQLRLYEEKINNLNAACQKQLGLCSEERKSDCMVKNESEIFANFHES